MKGLRKGIWFAHKRLLNPQLNGQDQMCQITRIAQGKIYYKAYYGLHDDGTPWYGFFDYIPEEVADRYISIRVNFKPS